LKLIFRQSHSEEDQRWIPIHFRKGGVGIQPALQIGLAGVSTRTSTRAKGMEASQPTKQWTSLLRQEDAKAAAKLECAPYGTTQGWGYVSKWFKDPTSVIRYVNSLGHLPSRPQQFASEGGAMAKVRSG